MGTDGPLNILIIGAGMVGISTAIWLQRDGHKVTVVDREGPAAGASFGNGGVLASSSVVPVTVPGLLGKAPGMLFSPNQPLFLKWKYLPKLVPFLKTYLAHSKAAAVEKTSVALTQVLHDAPDQHLSLAHGTPASEYIAPGDYLFGYKDKSAFLADSFGWNLRTRRGFKFEEMDAPALARFDPALQGRFGYGVRCQNHGQITDPGAYVVALAKHFETLGGVVKAADLKDFQIAEGRCVRAVTSQGNITADKYILCIGAWSGRLANKLGIKVPIESERGYHIEFVNPSITLRAPLMVSAGKFVVNSMNGRLRCAGVVEFGGLDAPASRGPVELLKRQMRELFPDLTYDRIDEWMGHRPATVDSVPVIGVCPMAENILVGYGHHHIGLTGGPKTGRWLAKLAAGEPINEDLAAYSPGRKKTK